MVSRQDSETVLAGGIFNSVCLTVITNIAVLSNTLTIDGGFFSKDGAILLSESGAKSSVSGVKSLFFQNFSILRVNKLTKGTSCQARNKNNSKHFDEDGLTVTIFCTSSCV